MPLILFFIKAFLHRNPGTWLFSLKFSAHPKTHMRALYSLNSGIECLWMSRVVYVCVRLCMYVYACVCRELCMYVYACVCHELCMFMYVHRYFFKKAYNITKSFNYKQTDILYVLHQFRKKVWTGIEQQFCFVILLIGLYVLHIEAGYLN